MDEFEFTKRNLLLTRLEIAKLSSHLGQKPWSLVTNRSYEYSQTSISVIVSLYNYSEYIYECLDSLSVSKNDNIPGGFEVIIIDDCSTDNSVSLVEKYIKKSDIPSCLVKKLFNTGLADARNVGLFLARSPYVFILDADNWIYSNCLSVLYNEITSSDLVSVYGIISRFDNDTKEEIGFASDQEWDVAKLVEHPYIDAMALFNKSIVLKLGGYSTELMAIGWSGWEDYDLWLKIAQENYTCKFVPQILSAYRVHSASMINITDKYKFDIAKYFTKKFYSLVSKYKHQINKLFSISHSELEKFNSFVNKHEADLKLIKDELVEKKREIKDTELQLRQTQQELELLNVKQYQSQSELEKLDKLWHESQIQIQQLQAQIISMQSSKFWKIRTTWIQFKQAIKFFKK
jgi:glycosyltransferase involved in cell wall biosynthesis